MSFEVKPLAALLEEKQRKKGNEETKIVASSSSSQRIGARRMRRVSSGKPSPSSALDELATAGECTRHVSTIATRSPAQVASVLQSPENPTVALRMDERITDAVSVSLGQPAAIAKVPTQPAASAKVPGRRISMQSSGNAQIVVQSPNATAVTTRVLTSTTVTMRTKSPPVRHHSSPQQQQQQQLVQLSTELGVNSSFSVTNHVPSGSQGRATPVLTNRRTSSSAVLVPTPISRQTAGSKPVSLHCNTLSLKPLSQQAVSKPVSVNCTLSSSTPPVQQGVSQLVSRNCENMSSPTPLSRPASTKPAPVVCSLSLRAATRPKASTPAPGRVMLRRSVTSPPPTSLAPAESTLPPSGAETSRTGGDSVSTPANPWPAFNPVKRLSSDSAVPEGKRPRRIVLSRSPPFRKTIQQNVDASSASRPLANEIQSQKGGEEEPMDSAGIGGWSTGSTASDVTTRNSDVTTRNSDVTTRNAEKFEPVLSMVSRRTSASGESSTGSVALDYDEDDDADDDDDDSDDDSNGDDDMMETSGLGQDIVSVHIDSSDEINDLADAAADGDDSTSKADGRDTRPSIPELKPMTNSRKRPESPGRDADGGRHRHRHERHESRYESRNDRHRSRYDDHSHRSRSAQQSKDAVIGQVAKTAEPASSPSIREETHVRHPAPTPSREETRERCPGDDRKHERRPGDDVKRERYPGDDGRRERHPADNMKRDRHPGDDVKRERYPADDGRRERHLADDRKRERRPGEDVKRDGVGSSTTQPCSTSAKSEKGEKMSTERIDEAHQWLIRRSLCKYFLNRRKGCRVKRCSFKHAVPHDMPDFVDLYCQEELWRDRVWSWETTKGKASGSPFQSPPSFADTEDKRQQQMLAASSMLKKDLETGWQAVVDIEKEHPESKLPASCYEEVISACRHSSGLASHGPVALQAFHRLAAARPAGHSRYDFCDVIAILSHARMIEEAFAEYARMKEAFSPVYEVIVDLLDVCKAVDPQRGFTLVADIQQNSLFRAHILDQLFTLCQEDKALAEKMCSALKLARDTNVSASESTYLALMSLLVEAADFEKAFQLLGMSGLRTLPKKLFVSLCQAGSKNPENLRMSLEILFSHDAALQAQLPAQVWSGLVSLCCKSKEPQDAGRVYRAAKACDVTISREAAAHLLATSKGSGSDSDVVPMKNAEDAPAPKSSRQRSTVAGAAPAKWQPKPAPMHAVCERLLEERSWAKLYEVVISMLPNNQMPSENVLELLVKALGDASNFTHLLALGMECVKADVKTSAGFYQDVMRVLMNSKADPVAAGQLYKLLAAKQVTAQTKRRPGHGDQRGSRVCTHWLSRGGCRRDNCKFEHPSSRAGKHHSLSVQPLLHHGNDGIHFVVEIMKHCAKRSLWADFASHFLELQHSSDPGLQQVALTDKSQWVCNALQTPGVRSGTAFRDFVAVLHEMCPDHSSGAEVGSQVTRHGSSGGGDTGGPLRETDEILLAHVGVCLLQQLAREQSWPEAYLVLFSLHTHQIQYLSEAHMQALGLSYPNQLSRCRVALLGVRACAEVKEARSAVMVLTASDFAALTSSDPALAAEEERERADMLEQLAATFLDCGDLVTAFTIVQHLLEPATGPPRNGVEIARKCANFCAQAVSLASGGELRDGGMAVQVYEYMASRSLVADGTLAKTMYKQLLGLVVDSQRLTLARQVFLAALREHLYDCSRIVSPLHLLTLKAYELTAAELFLVIEHYLYELADSLQSKHAASQRPWSFLVRPSLERQPVMLMVKCAPGLGHRPSADCERCVQTVRQVLAEYMPPALTAQVRPQLENDCHTLLLDAGPLMRWFTTNSKNPYNIQQFPANAESVTASPATAALSAPSPSSVYSTGNNSSGSSNALPTVHVSPCSDLEPASPGQRLPTGHRSATSRLSPSAGKPSHEKVPRQQASHGHGKDMQTLSRRSAKSANGGGVSLRHVKVEHGALFGGRKILQHHVARCVCRQLTKHMRSGSIAETQFKVLAHDVTHSFMSLLDAEGSVPYLRNDSSLEARIKQHADEKFLPLLKTKQ